MTEPIYDQTVIPLIYKIEQINWEFFKNLGLTRTMIEADKQLEYLLQGRKTTKLFNIALEQGNMSLSCQARIQLWQGPEQYLQIKVFGIKQSIDLQRKFMGHEFTATDKYNLLTMGNMGRVVTLKDPISKQFLKSIISVDKLTNDLVYLPANQIRIPTTIKGVTINHEQVKNLLQGKAVFISKMLSRNNRHFNAHVQFNADKKYIEFIFDNRRLVDQNFVEQQK